MATMDNSLITYVRHELSSYDEALWAAAGKAGVALAVAELRRRVYAAIAQAYPNLADECRRQLGERHQASF